MTDQAILEPVSLEAPQSLPIQLKIGAGRPGPGRPKAEIERRYFRVMRSVCNPRRFRNVVDSVTRKAEEGDLQAAKLLFDRLLPTDRLEDLGAFEGQINVLVVSSDELEMRRERLREAIVV